MHDRRDRTTYFALFSAAYAAVLAELLHDPEHAALSTEELQDLARTRAKHLGRVQMEMLEHPQATAESAADYFEDKHKFAQEVYQSEVDYPNLEDIPDQLKD